MAKSIDQRRTMSSAFGRPSWPDQVSIWSVLRLKCTENGRWPPVISDCDNGTRSCANRITHTHTYRTQDLLYLVSSQTAFTWLTDQTICTCACAGRRQVQGIGRGRAGQCVHVVNRRYAHAHRDRGGADSCAFGRGGADSMTFDLKTK